MNSRNSASRRTFFKTSARLGAFGGLVTGNRVAAAGAAVPPKPAAFKISLAEWSLNRRCLQRPGSERLDNLEYAQVARPVGIDGIAYVNPLFKDQGGDEVYLGEVKQRAASEGVQSLPIMCDGEGSLGDPLDAARAKTIGKHLKGRRDAAAFLGGHSIRAQL